ncbi:MAG: DUF4932 domain-containing protein [Bacteroidales bacterium]|nr:DUF4932 domain-containing protein [Bacteroidales bacterium]
MRKILIVSTIVMIALSCTNLLAQETYEAPEAITHTKNQINVSVRPQIELISIIQTISDYPLSHGLLMSKDTFEYKTDVIHYFSKYKGHQVVKMFDRLSSRPEILNYNIPSLLMHHTDNGLHLKEDIIIDSSVITRAGGKDSLVVFLNLLRDFAIQSSFNKFFNEHKDFYSTIIERTVDNLGDYNYIYEIEDFYGKSQRSYSIILVPLYNFVGYGNSLLYPDGKRDLFNTMGPQKVENNIPFFGDENHLKYVIRHEFSHSFINPLTEKYWDYIKPYSSNFVSIPDTIRNKYYSDWQQCINEFVIRSITTNIAYNESNEMGTWAYRKEQPRGVSYIDSVLNKIKYYQSNRITYPTLEAYYYKLLDTFKEEYQIPNAETHNK